MFVCFCPGALIGGRLTYSGEGEGGGVNSWGGGGGIGGVNSVLLLIRHAGMPRLFDME